MVAKKKKLQFPASMFKTHAAGSTHRMFGVPNGVKLPRTFLQKVVDTPLMETARNPTKIGKKSIKVTHLVKARANGVLNAIRLKKAPQGHDSGLWQDYLME
jgi:hypothetical protein